ncbi:19503_t:CDS:1, partial [Racocetra persica]
GEKIAPHVFKLANLQTLQKYLQKEKIKYETYQEIAENETEFTHEDQELEKAYKQISQDQERKKLTKPAQKAALRDLQKRL